MNTSRRTPLTWLGRICTAALIIASVSIGGCFFDDHDHHDHDHDRDHFEHHDDYNR